LAEPCIQSRFARRITASVGSHEQTGKHRPSSYASSVRECTCSRLKSSRHPWSPWICKTTSSYYTHRDSLLFSSSCLLDVKTRPKRFWKPTDWLSTGRADPIQGYSYMTPFLLGLRIKLQGEPSSALGPDRSVNSHLEETTWEADRRRSFVIFHRGRLSAAWIRALRSTVDARQISHAGQGMLDGNPKHRCPCPGQTATPWDVLLPRKGLR
jgi:hypothetical protein